LKGGLRNRRILFAFHYDLLTFTNKYCDGDRANGVRENGPR
jgi:hypothetical protein